MNDVWLMISWGIILSNIFFRAFSRNTLEGSPEIYYKTNSISLVQDGQSFDAFDADLLPEIDENPISS